MSRRRLRSLARRVRQHAVLVALALAIVAIGARVTTAAVDPAVDPCAVQEVIRCVQVPDVRYELLDDAMVILEQAGLVALPPRGAALDRMILSQRPGPGVLVVPDTVVRLDLVPLPPVDPTTTSTSSTTTAPATTARSTATTGTGTSVPSSPSSPSSPSTSATSVAGPTPSRPKTTSPTAPTPSRPVSSPPTGPSSVPVTTAADGSTTTTAAATTPTGSSVAPTTVLEPVPPTRPAFDPVAFVARHARGGAPVLVALVGSLLVRRRRRPPRRTRRPALPLVARFGAQGRLMGSTGGEGGLIARFAPRPPHDTGAPDDHDPE